MWGFWRVFNTLQPDLATLPDRAQDDLNGPIPVGVNSAGLLGKSFNGLGSATATTGAAAAPTTSTLSPEAACQ